MYTWTLKMETVTYIPTGTEGFWSISDECCSTLVYCMCTTYFQWTQWKGSCGLCRLVYAIGQSLAAGSKNPCWQSGFFTPESTTSWKRLLHFGLAPVPNEKYRLRSLFPFKSLPLDIPFLSQVDIVIYITYQSNAEQETGPHLDRKEMQINRATVQKALQPRFVLPL